MPSLDDFNKVNKTLGLEDFTSPLPSVGGTNKASNQNMAAQVASMSKAPEEVYSNYRRVTDELGMEGQSEAAMQLVEEARREHMKGNREGLISLLSDPTISDEDKQNIALGAVDKANEAWKFENVISDNALMSQSEGETPEQEYVRVSLADEVAKINEAKRKQQIMLNAEINKNNTGVMETGVEIAELLIPFMEQGFVQSIMQKLGKDFQGKLGADEALLFMGQAKIRIKETIANAPPAEQLRLTQLVIDAVNKSSSIVLPTENDFARVDFLRSVLEDGYYEDGSQFLDNVVSVLDLVGLGGFFKAGAKGARAAEAAASGVRRDYVTGAAQPSTLSNNVMDFNPEKYRRMHDTAAADMTGEAAEALYGTDRASAIATDIFPQIPRADEALRAKVAGADQAFKLEITPDAGVMNFVDADGMIYYWKEEKQGMVARVINDFSNAVGSFARPEMSTTEVTGTGVLMKQVYGGVSRNPQMALDMIKHSLRDYDVADDAVVLLRREGSMYVPTTVKEVDAMTTVNKVVERNGINVVVPVPKDFLVQVKHEYKFNPLDAVGNFVDPTVKYNFFDRLGLFTGKSGGGSLQEHMLDAHSMLAPEITKGANVVVDRAAGLEGKLSQMENTFGTAYKKADNPQLMMRHIKEANAKGENFNYVKMAADGMSPKDIAGMRTWREYWDTIYSLENRDMAKTLSARGFKEFVDELTDTKLFAKPVVRSQAKVGVRVLDTATDQVVTMDKVALDALYGKDGLIARMRDPVKIGDEAIEFILNANSAKQHLKAIGSGTQVLNYRKGYYAVQYPDPHHIVKVVKNSRGVVLYEKSIGTAANVKDADRMVERMKGVDTEGNDYYRRHDKKRETMESDSYFETQTSGGRSAQRVRGKQLEDATGNIHPETSNILDPIDAMTNAARSVSRRVIMRDYFEATKGRFLNQFKHLLPVNKYGEPVFPNNVKDIHFRGGQTERGKELADAITTFNYINHLEHGWVNAIDDGFKLAFKNGADWAGEAGFAGTEMLLRRAADLATPMQAMRVKAFEAYLALNPQRQIFVQSHQAVQLLANYPLHFLKAGGDVTQLVKGALNHEVLPEFAQMVKEYERSGLGQAVDKNNLLNGAMQQIADSRQLPLGLSDVGKVYKGTVNAVKKVGFDAGENFNLMTAWATIRRDVLSTKPAGHKLTDTELDEIGALARNYTYNMNAAGDMPYNQNMLSMLLQFAQVPHKAIAQMTTNRILSTPEKARIAAFNTFMYGLPAGAIYGVLDSFDLMPEDLATREALDHGFESVAFNYMIEAGHKAITGEDLDVRIDFGSINPVDPMGVVDTIVRVLTEDQGTILAASPAGRLFFGNNPKITEAFMTIARYTNVIDDYESNPTTFSAIAKSFAGISSGMSNAFKAAYALEYQRKIGSTGGVTDPNVNTPEAIAALFGFGTLDEAMLRKVNNETYHKSKAFKDDVGEWYNQFKIQLLKEGISPQEQQFATSVLAEAWRVFGNDNYEGKQIIVKKLQRDLSNGDQRVVNQLLKMTGFMNAEDLKVLIMQTPNMTDHQRKELLGTVENIQSQKDNE